MRIYKVYGETFRNKKLAIAYHKKIFGNANWQSSTVFDTKTGKITSLSQNKIIFN